MGNGLEKKEASFIIKRNKRERERTSNFNFRNNARQWHEQRALCEVNDGLCIMIKYMFGLFSVVAFHAFYFIMSASSTDGSIP